MSLRVFFDPCFERVVRRRVVPDTSRNTCKAVLFMTIRRDIAEPHRVPAGRRLVMAGSAIAAEALMSNAEIGRASCRERVCYAV